MVDHSPARRNLGCECVEIIDGVLQGFVRLRSSSASVRMIAAEQLGRTCYAMEISPAYCDVAVQRWEKLTGEKAELEN